MLEISFAKNHKNTWPAVCLFEGMSRLKRNSQKKSDDVARVTMAPANVLAEPRFGLVDGVIVLLFVICAAGLLYWILG